LACQANIPPEVLTHVARFEADSPSARLTWGGRPVYAHHDALMSTLGLPLPKGVFRTMAVIPISHDGRVVASLAVCSGSLDEFPPAVCHTLEGIAAQIGAALARHKAEAERERLATAVGQAAEAIVITDPDGRIEYANPAFERITGYSGAELVGQNPNILKSGQQDAGFYRQLWDTIRTGDTWRGRFINRRKDGTFYQEDATISRCAMVGPDHALRGRQA